MIGLSSRRRSRARNRLTPAQLAALLIMLAVTLFPIYWMVMASLKTNVELLGGARVSLLPDLRALQLGNYLQMLQVLQFASYLRNSLIVCAVATVGAVALASLAGFTLGYFRFRGSGAYGIAVIATQLLPGILFLLPVYLIFRQIEDATGVQLIDTYQGLILLYVVGLGAPRDPLPDTAWTSWTRAIERNEGYDVIAPEAIFTSEPPLAQEEIISLIATGATRQELSTGNVLAGRAAMLLVQQLYRKIVKKGEPTESNTVFNRLDLDLGTIDPRTGQQQATVRFKIDDHFVLTGDVGVHGDFRGKLKYLIRFR